MLPYLLVTAPVAVMAVLSPLYRRYPLIWGSVFLILLVFIGLRHHVGMDWNNYLWMIRYANEGSFINAFAYAEPGYAILLWIFGQAGLGIYGVYLSGTAIFLAGLFRYCKTTPSPWIALLVAMPFLVIVISMSAARQTVAIGVILWLFAEWPRASLKKRLAFILLATSFHISAAGFLVFMVLDFRIPAWLKVLAVAFFGGVIVYILNVSGQAEYYDSVYGSGQTQTTQSAGAVVHVLLNAGPAMMCFLLGKRARAILMPERFQVQMAILAIILLGISLVASTAASRMSLYVFPVSIRFFSVLPLLFLDSNSRIALKACLGAFFLSFLVVWLSAGNSAVGHAHYRNALFVPYYELELCCQ